MERKIGLRGLNWHWYIHFLTIYIFIWMFFLRWTRLVLFMYKYDSYGNQPPKWGVIFSFWSRRGIWHYRWQMRVFELSNLQVGVCVIISTNPSNVAFNPWEMVGNLNYKLEFLMLLSSDFCRGSSRFLPETVNRVTHLRLDRWLLDKCKFCTWASYCLVVVDFCHGYLDKTSNERIYPDLLFAWRVCWPLICCQALHIGIWLDFSVL